MKIVVGIQLLSHLFLAARACTEIRVKAKDNSIVVGRTMDFMISLASNIIVEPKDYPPNCSTTSELRWSFDSLEVATQAHRRILECF